MNRLSRIKRIHILFIVLVRRDRLQPTDSNRGDGDDAG